MKAIAIAQSQGQKVFTITSANAAIAIPQLQQRSSVIDEITNAVNAGKEVTIHQSPITANGWTGVGYVVVDPQTGSGAYLIEGGARGGIYDDDYKTRYLAWVSGNLIQFDDTQLNYLLLLLLPLYKEWFGWSPYLLGAYSPATTLLSAIQYILAQLGIAEFGLRALGRAGIFPLAIFIGFYNVTILLSGFFYASARDTELEYAWGIYSLPKYLRPSVRIRQDADWFFFNERKLTANLG